MIKRTCCTQHKLIFSNGRSLNRTAGFTLIELIVALAIIGIMAVSFLTVFSTTYAHIFSAGRKSDAVFQTEQKVESAIATGTTSTTDVFLLTIGGRTVSLTGEVITESTIYENGKIVEIKSFVPKDSVFSRSETDTESLALEIYANELEIMVGAYYQLEANKTVTWISSQPSVASVDSTGRITGHQEGTATITATAGSESKTCTVRIVDKVTLAYVKGGQFIRYNGVDYVKLTGENGRVMTLTAPVIAQPWTFVDEMPSRGELEGDQWTDALRVISGLDYWTKTYRTSGNSGQALVTLVKSDGSFDEKNSNNAYYGLKLATALNPDLIITSGTGLPGSPYLLADPAP